MIMIHWHILPLGAMNRREPTERSTFEGMAARDMSCDFGRHKPSTLGPGIGTRDGLAVMSRY